MSEEKGNVRGVQRSLTFVDSKADKSYKVVNIEHDENQISCIIISDTPFGPPLNRVRELSRSLQGWVIFLRVAHP